MKRVNFKSILMALAVTLAFLFAGTERGNAQGLGDGGIFAQPTGAFLNSDQAKQKLLTAISADRLSASAMPYGSAFFNQFYNRAKFFGFIYIELRDNNATVPNAIVEALKKLSLGDQNNNVVPAKQLLPYKNDAIQFLKN